MRYDADILFNRGAWAELISSQERLFKPDEIRVISDGLRVDFHEGHQPGRQMPVIPPRAYGDDILNTFDNHIAGYDLPCLLSADRPTRGRVMLCAQDPLRKGSQKGITVGTFFGIDSDRLRQVRKHYGMIWQLIRRLVTNGYDVWVTDAMKIYAKGLRMDHRIYQICGEVLRREVQQFDPDHIMAFGNGARDVLRGFGLTQPVIHERHPTAFGSSATWAAEGASRAYCDTTQGRLEAKVDRYCRNMLGRELPMSAQDLAAHRSDCASLQKPIQKVCFL